MKQCLVVFLGILLCISTVVHAEDPANSDPSILVETLGTGVLPAPATFAITDASARVFGLVHWDTSLVTDRRLLREPLVSEQLVHVSNSAVDFIDEDNAYDPLMSGSWVHNGPLGPGCEVNCPGGSFACCGIQSEESSYYPMCSCIEEGSSEDSCISGGEGATGCRIELESVY